MQGSPLTAIAIGGIDATTLPSLLARTCPHCGQPLSPGGGYPPAP